MYIFHLCYYNSFNFSHIKNDSYYLFESNSNLQRLGNLNHISYFIHVKNIK